MKVEIFRQGLRDRQNRRTHPVDDAQIAANVFQTRLEHSNAGKRAKRAADFQLQLAMFVTAAEDHAVFDLFLFGIEKKPGPSGMIRIRAMSDQSRVTHESAGDLRLHRHRRTVIECSKALRTRPRTAPIPSMLTATTTVGRTAKKPPTKLAMATSLE